jgi:uncharacterized protein (TIGR03032 family)
VIFVNTKYSCLATTSTRHGFKPIWKPKFISKLAAEDRCHLNGLAMEDGRPRYVTAVSSSDVVTGWRARRSEGGVLIDIENDRVVTDQLSMPHSPRVADGQIWALDSGRGWLIRIDPQTGRKEDVTFCPGFLRGLSIHGGFAIATMSLPRESDFSGLALQDELKTRDADPWCGICVINLRTGDIVEWIRLHGLIHELFDVAIMADVTCPMAIGSNSPELRDLISFENEFAPRGSEDTPPGS